jgi:hypothetical protein
MLATSPRKLGNPVSMRDVEEPEPIATSTAIPDDTWEAADEDVGVCLLSATGTGSGRRGGGGERERERDPVACQRYHMVTFAPLIAQLADTL